jgi:RNA polymerase sigma-70 factor (ECF subfamily)
VKGWLARAAATAVGRGPAYPVDDSLFQGRDDPFPGHWRQPPAPWPAGLTSDDAARGHVRDALAALPPPWRAVVRSRDVAGRPAAEVAAGLGLASGQERQILNMARAALRASLSRLAR